MRALVYQNQNLVLQHDYPRPSLRSGEALIRVLVVGICNTDLEIIRGYMGFSGVLGHEFVGIVEEISGEAATEQYQYLLGRRVVGEINAACHRNDCLYCRQGMPTHCPNRSTLGIMNRDGACAEYVALPVENLHIVPDTITDEEAVFVEPLAANFEILEQVHIQPTQHVVIVGDGKMGQLAARVLTLNGCKVSLIGKHKEKLALAESCGVHMYPLATAEQLLLADGKRVDVVIECSGSAQGLEMALRLVRPRGCVVLKSTVADQSMLHLAPIVIDEIRIQGSRCGPFAPALRALEQKRVDVRPLVSARYALDEGVAAFTYAGQQGVLKVLLKI